MINKLGFQEVRIALLLVFLLDSTDKHEGCLDYVYRQVFFQKNDKLYLCTALQLEGGGQAR